MHCTLLGLTAALEHAGFNVTGSSTSTSSVGLPATIQYALFGRCLFPAGLALRVATGLCVVAFPLARALDSGGGDQSPRRCPRFGLAEIPVVLALRLECATGRGDAGGRLGRPPGPRARRAALGACCDAMSGMIEDSRDLGGDIGSRRSCSDLLAFRRRALTFGSRGGADVLTAGWRHRRRPLARSIRPWRDQPLMFGFALADGSVPGSSGSTPRTHISPPGSCAGSRQIVANTVWASLGIGISSRSPAWH